MRLISFKFDKNALTNTKTQRRIYGYAIEYNNNLQAQIKKLFPGMFDAYGKILRYEGFSGLYKGFWVSSVQIVSGKLSRSGLDCHYSFFFTGVFYISTYEGVRHILAQRNIDSRVRALVAGGIASMVGQTIIVPFDVLSQHLMMMGIDGRGEKVNRSNFYIII